MFSKFFKVILIVALILSTAPINYDIVFAEVLNDVGPTLEETDTGGIGNPNEGEVGNLPPIKAQTDLIMDGMSISSFFQIIGDDNDVYSQGIDGYSFNSSKPVIDIYTPKAKGFAKSESTKSGGSTFGIIDLTGDLYIWGSNRSGETGHGITSADIPRADMVKVPIENVKDVFISDKTVAVLEDGSVWTWGREFVSKMRGSIEYSSEVYPPRKGEGIENAVSVEGGDSRFSVITEDGLMYTWGFDGFRQLGLSCPDDFYSNNTHYTGAYLEPVLVGSCEGLYPPMTGFIKADSTHHTSLALKDNGDLVSWGKGTFSLRGTNDVPREEQTPTKMDGFAGRVIDFSVGWSHGLAVDEYGYLYSWGVRDQGVLGKVKGVFYFNIYGFDCAQSFRGGCSQR